MAKLRVHRKGYKRKSYTRKGGVRVGRASVGRSTFLIKDRGKPGRTSKSQQWYEPQVETGWHKDLDIKTRRALALKAHKGDMLATARGLQALANVTTDSSTKAKARADAKYFFDEHSKTGR